MRFEPKTANGGRDRLTIVDSGARGNLLVGAEAYLGYLCGPNLAGAAGNLRIGLAVRDNMLIYALAGVEDAIGGPFFWTARAGAAIAVGNRASLFAELGVYGGFWACCAPSWRVGVNIHR